MISRRNSREFQPTSYRNVERQQSHSTRVILLLERRKDGILRGLVLLDQLEGFPGGHFLNDSNFIIDPRPFQSGG
jgi:hypothetical protein